MDTAQPKSDRRMDASDTSSTDDYDSDELIDADMCPESSDSDMFAGSDDKVLT